MRRRDGDTPWRRRVVIAEAVGRALRLLVLVALMLATACTGDDPAPEPQDRAAQAAAITATVEGLSGVAEVRDDYRLGVSGEPDRFTMTVELANGVGDARACAPVAAYLTGVTDSGISAEGSTVEVRDDSGTAWRFLAEAGVGDAGVSAAFCEASREARDVPRAALVRVFHEAGLSTRPTIAVSFPVGEVRSTPEAQRLTEQTVSTYDEFRWLYDTGCTALTCR